MRWLYLYLIVFIGCSDTLSQYQCPCSFSPLETIRNNSIRTFSHVSQLHICIDTRNITNTNTLHNFNEAIEYISKDISFTIISDDIKSNSNYCHVNLNLIHLVDSYYSQRHICPGDCSGVPTRSFPVEYLKKNVEWNNIPLTCSLTSSMISSKDIKVILKEIALRIILECNEQKYWNVESLKLPIERNVIKSVIIWIGSKSNFQLIQDQSIALKDLPMLGSDGVIAWAGTDELYSCNNDAVECKFGNRKKFHRYLPRSSMSYLSKGWGCAQRRPLRALAHILLLYDPLFVVLVDDDTFVNYQLLYKSYQYLLEDEMIRFPIVLGELTGAEGPDGHLTLKGFYAGGAGYIIGKLALSILIKNEVYFWKDDMIDNFRSVQQINHLSLAYEAKELSKYCVNENMNSAHCVILQPHPSSLNNRSHTYKQINKYQDIHENEADLVLTIGTRLIDLCVNVLANENTCYHR